MKIYTRTGDRGETSLFGGQKLRKDSPRIEAYGTVDELNSFIGQARSAWPGGAIDAELERIQNDLFEVGAALASPSMPERFPGVPAARVNDLEQAIDEMDARLPQLRNFILPGGTTAASHLHIARTVCRRAERNVIALNVDDGHAAAAVVYLNRLSDYLFTAARLANLAHGREDVEWKGQSR